MSLEWARAAQPDVGVFSQNGVGSEPNFQFPGLTSRLPIHLYLSVYEGYDDNPLTTSSASGSLFTSGSLTLSYGLNNVRTKVDLTASAGATYYSELNNRTYDKNDYIRLSIVHDISQRLNISASINAAYRTAPDFSSNVGPETRQGNFFETSDSLSLSYHWSPSFSTVTSVDGRRVSYDRSSVGMSEDRSEGTGGEQFQFTLQHRATALVAEYRYEVIRYDTFPRDSSTHFMLAGFDESLGPKFKLTARGGATIRSYESNNVDRTDPHFETS